MSITAGQTQTSANFKFLAIHIQDQNELHVWDINSARARCLARLRPSELLAQKADVSASCQFSTICFSASQVSVLV